MQQSSPAKPEIIRMFAYILQNLHCMLIVIFMSTPVAGFHLIKCTQFRNNQFEQPRILQIIETGTWMLSEHNLIQFISNAFAADNLQTVGISLQSLISFRLYLKIKLGSKTDATHHTKRIVGKSNIRIQWCSNDAIFHIIYTIKRIYQFAKSFFIQTNCHGIDGKITPILIIL